MKLSTVVVLGASWQQVPLIRAVRAAGFGTITVDQDAAAVGAREADKFVVADIADSESVATALIGYEPIGVVTSGVEAALPTQAALAIRYGVPGPPPSAIPFLTDKLQVSVLAEELGIPHPSRIHAPTVEEALRAVAELDYPVVVKPTLGSGSEGVQVVRDARELSCAWHRARAAGRSGGSVCVEEFVPGVESGIQYFPRTRTRRPLSFAHNDLLAPSGLGPRGHSMPHASAASERRLVEIAEAIAQHLDYSWPLNLDVIDRGGTLYLIEAAGRLGGGCLPRLIELHTGLDPYRILLDLAVGSDSQAGHHFAPVTAVAALCVGASHAGVLESIDVGSLPEGTSYVPSSEVGASCRPFLSARDAVGVVYAASDTYAAAEDLANAACKAVAVNVRAEPRTVA